MKSKIFLIVCGVVFSLYFSSCKKNTDSSIPTPQTDSAKKIMVSLQPAGEFTFNQSIIPGAKLSSGHAGAKELIDSTLYMAEVYASDKLYAIGRFDRLDSVHFIVDPATSYTVRLTAIQRGTGPGLGYRFRGDGPFYYAPLYDFVTNTMNYAPGNYSQGLGLVYEIGKYGFTTFPLPDLDENIFYNYFGEVIAYTGTTTVFNVDPNHPTISVSLKRLAFGIKYTCPQLTQGKLTISGRSWYTQDKVIYPNTIDTLTSIYSCLDFIVADTIPARSYNMYGPFEIKIVWELPDGRKFNLGRDSSNNFYTALPYPRLNRVLNVKVTLPDIDSSGTGSGSLGLKIIETPLTENPPIRF